MWYLNINILEIVFIGILNDELIILRIHPRVVLQNNQRKSKVYGRKRIGEGDVFLGDKIVAVISCFS